MNQRYVIQKGDTLWDLSGQFLGKPTEWPRLFAYNNRQGVVKITGRGIRDPDLIYPGQVLLIPQLAAAPAAPPSAISPPSQAPRPGTRPAAPAPPRLKDQLPNVTIPFAIKYKLDDLPLMTSVGPGFKATIKMSGTVIIELGRKLPLSYVLNQGMDAKFKRETDAVLATLISETKVDWDAKTDSISYSSMMVTKSKTPGAPSTAIGIKVSSNKPVPVLRAEIRFPKLHGRINSDSFAAFDVKVVIELEPTVPPPPGTRPVPVPTPSPETVKTVTTWMFVGGVALLVGTIVADFLTAGASIADDPVTIAAALAMMGVGVVAPQVEGGQPIEIH